MRGSLWICAPMSVGLKNILTESADHCRRIAIDQPVLTHANFAKLAQLNEAGFVAKTIDTVFEASGEDGALVRALSVSTEVEAAIDAGASVLILSDRNTDRTHVPIPSLLAASAVHHHLIRVGKRGHADVIVEAGDVREVHHFATVLGYGASAVYPYVALDTLAQMEQDNLLEVLLQVSPRTSTSRR